MNFQKMLISVNINGKRAENAIFSLNLPWEVNSSQSYVEERKNAITFLSFFQNIMWMKKVLMIFMISSFQVAKSNGNNIDYSLFGTPRFKLKAGNCENGGNPTYIVEG